MRKLLFSALVFTLIFALSSWATETRVITLGNANNIVMDDYNIFLYPSVITMYRYLAAGEVASSSYYPESNSLTYADYLYRVGAHYSFGEDKGVVGMYVDRMGMDLPPGAPDVTGDGTVDSRLKMFYGRPFGDTDFGMMLDIYHDSYKRDGDNADKTEKANTALGIKLGLTLNKSLDIAAGIGFATWTNKGTDGNDVTKPESNMQINLDGRYWYEYSDMVYFIPHLGFMYGMSGYKVGDSSTKWNSMELNLGWGTNIRPEEHILLLFDLGIMYSTTTEKNSVELKDTDMHLPYYRIGLEGYVTKWWTLRLGAEKSWDNLSYDETEDISDKYGATSTSTYLGSGFTFGNLTLDAWLDPNFVLNGPNFVSGYNGDLAGMASIKYTWGE